MWRVPCNFSRHIEYLLHRLDDVTVYIDDILVTGTTLEEHLCNLEAVLKCLEEVGLHLNQDKCFYLCPYIECLAHLIDKDGIHPTQVKVQAIKEGPAPTNQLNYIHFWV